MVSASACLRALFGRQYNLTDNSGITLEETKIERRRTTALVPVATMEPDHGADRDINNAANRTNDGVQRGATRGVGHGTGQLSHLRL